MMLPPMPCAIIDSGGLAGHQEVAGEVHVERQPPLVRGHVHQRERRGDAGGVDEDVEPAPVGDQFFEGLADAVLAGDVALDGFDLALGTLLQDEGGRFLRRRPDRCRPGRPSLRLAPGRRPCSGPARCRRR